jgi:hypothetical protein
MKPIFSMFVPGAGATVRARRMPSIRSAVVPSPGLMPRRSTASLMTSQLFTMSTSVRTTSWLSGRFTLRDGASAGASCTVSPSFTSTLLCASQAPGRMSAAMVDAIAMMPNTPHTSHLCLKTAYRKLRAAIRPVAGSVATYGTTGVASGGMVCKVAMEVQLFCPSE